MEAANGATSPLSQAAFMSAWLTASGSGSGSIAKSVTFATTEIADGPADAGSIAPTTGNLVGEQAPLRHWLKSRRAARSKDYRMSIRAAQHHEWQADQHHALAAAVHPGHAPQKPRRGHGVR
jgi:hypothetical protein